VNYSNPVKKLEIDDYPIGGNNRGKCVFEVEHNETHGYRVSRKTTDKYGIWRKPSYGTYGGKAAIVTGEDGKTYILQHMKNVNAITIKRHDFKDGGSAVFMSDDPQEYVLLDRLIRDGQ
jgi:hypothetical protein